MLIIHFHFSNYLLLIIILTNFNFFLLTFDQINFHIFFFIRLIIVIILNFTHLFKIINFNLNQ